MRTRILALAGAVMFLIAGVFGGLVLAGSAGTASAQDPAPPPGMHEACERMTPEGMEGMHEGMMNAGGQMGEWMESGMGQ